MKLLHKKSKCCGAKIIRFGGKRRQCIACKKTWRMHQSKRGPKPQRRQCLYLKKVFEHGFRVKQLSLNSGLSTNALYKRFSNNLNLVIKQERIIQIKGARLILVIDAQWHYFKKELWTMYFLAVKSVDSETVTILDPILRQGKESADNWDKTFTQLPLSIRERIIILVSDGTRGIEAVAKKNNWLLQRCHFHLISALQKRRGKRASTPGRITREEIYSIAKRTLYVKSPSKLSYFQNRLSVLAQREECPKAMRMIVKDFLRHLPEFRMYLDYPEFKIPTTTNVMESVNSFVKEKAKTVNNPKAWHKWAIACARIKSKFICK